MTAFTMSFASIQTVMRLKVRAHCGSIATP